jgi:ferredoxin
VKIIVDLEKCTAQGRCYGIATQVFVRGPDGKSIIQVTDIGDDDTELQLQAQSAEMMCPEGAVTVEED